MLTLFLVIIPKPALSKAKILDVFGWRNTSLREISIELDPRDDNGCFSMGELDIVFHTDKNGPPDVGIVLTDPRGRRIGFDPLTRRAWQELPEAQGYIDCDDPDGQGSCRGVVQVCGPVSGAYNLEVIAQQTTAYSVSISARSKGFVDENGLHSSWSKAELNDVAIHARSQDLVLLNYSRDLQQDVSAQLERSLHAVRLDSPSERGRYIKSSERSAAGQ